MKDVDEIVFAARVSGRDHWYVNFAYYSDDSEVARTNGFSKDEQGVWWGYGEGGRLCRLNLRTGELKCLIDDPKGGVRDPQVHYDGQKILFSYRKGDDTRLSPLRDQHRRHRPAAVDRRPGRRHRADVPARRKHHVRFVAVPPVRQLLVQPRGGALPVRRRRQERPHDLEQQRPRQHAVGLARRANPLHALGVRRSQPGPFPPSLDDQSRRHGPDGLLRQQLRRRRRCSTPSRFPERTRW